MATDSKGTFFGRGNRGLATMLGRTQQGSFFDSANRVAQSRQAARQKEQEDILDMLEPDDIWAPFQQSGDAMLEEAVDLFAKGELSRADAMKYNIRYKSAMSMANDLQQQHKDALALYEKDDEIDSAFATNWRFRNVVGDGTVDSLKSTAVKDIDNEGFLTEWGGSQGLNQSNVVTNMVGDLRQTLTEFLGSEDKSYVGPGSVRFTRQRVEQLLNEAFTTGVDENLNPVVKVKDAATLRESGLLSSFLENRRFNRIVMDNLYNQSGQQRTNFTQQEIDDEAVRMINLYGADQQEVRITEDSSTARYSVPRQSGSGRDENDDRMRRKYWWQALSSNNPELQSLALSRFSSSFPFINYAQLMSIMDDKTKAELGTDNQRLLKKYDDMGLTVVRSGYDSEGTYLVVQATDPKGEWRKDSVKKIYVDIDGFNEQDWYALYDNATPLSISEQDTWLPQRTPEEIRQMIEGGTARRTQQPNTQQSGALDNL